jgi:hypothetical protein
MLTPKKRELTMASNFTINVHRTQDHVCMKLNGDFDGNSACELINLLNVYFGHRSKILVDTDSLKRIYPFGLNVFHNRLIEVKPPEIPLIFTGKLSSQFSLQ